MALKIHPDTIKFLRDLARNNNREWFADHKSNYEAAKKDFKNYTAQLIQELAKFDATLNDLTPEQCIFRLFRDVRFAKNKLPYKTNFGAFMAPAGRKSGLAGYYIHIQPGNHSMIGGGLYHPEAAFLSKIRKQISDNPAPLKLILNKPGFKKTFGELQGERLKTIPRGYSKDHPEKELLRYKDFLVSNNIDDKLLTSPELTTTATYNFKKMKELITYLNNTINQ